MIYDRVESHNEKGKAMEENGKSFWDVMVSVPMTIEERDRLREASRELGVPQGALMRDGGLEEAGRWLWKHRQRASARAGIRT